VTDRGPLLGGAVKRLSGIPACERSGFVADTWTHRWPRVARARSCL